jgi:hypothetical protein
MKKVVASLALLAGLLVAAATDAKPRAGSSREVPIQTAGTLPALGPAVADVTVELFFNPMTLPPEVLESLVQMQRRHPAQVRVLFCVLSQPGQLLVPDAFVEAHAQNRFFEFLRLALAHRNPGGFRRDQLMQLALAANMDTSSLAAAWTDGRHAASLLGCSRRRDRRKVLRDPVILRHHEIFINGAELVLQGRPLAETLLSASAVARRAADEALDRGVAPAQLLAFLTRHPGDALPPSPPRFRVVVDECIDCPDASVLPSTLSRPLPPGVPFAADTGGASPEVVVTILCNLLRPSCHEQDPVGTGARIAEVYRSQVRVQWLPFFAVEDSSTTVPPLTLGIRGVPQPASTGETLRAHDAALCAHDLGRGWEWIREAARMSRRQYARSVDQQIDAVASALDLSTVDLARCMALRAGDSGRVVAAVRASGIVAAPTIVIGDQVFSGTAATAADIAGVVELELRGGVLERLSAPSTRADLTAR